MGWMPADARMPAGNHTETRYRDWRFEHSEIPPFAAQQALRHSCNEIDGAYDIEEHMEARQRDRNVACEAVLTQGVIGRTCQAPSGRRNTRATACHRTGS
jgi:hypothetical protein